MRVHAADGQLTESPTSSLPSGDPLDLLTDRQFLIICAKTAGRNLSRISRVLHISRETLYQELHRAERAIRPFRVGGTGVELCDRCRAEPRLPGRRVGQRCRSQQRALGARAR